MENLLKEIRDIENRESNTRAHARGRYQNIMLTEDEYRELATEITGLDRLIEELSEYMKSTGRAYADHAATLQRWARKENTHSAPDYSCKEGESL